MAQPDVNVKGFTLAQKMVGRACGVDGVVPGASRSLFRSFGFWVWCLICLSYWHVWQKDRFALLL